MADQQQPPVPPSSSSPSAQPQPQAQTQAQAQPAQPSQTGSQEPPPQPGHPDAPSESPVVPKQEPDTAGNVDLDASIEQDIDMSAGENHHNAANGAEGDGTESGGNGNGNGNDAGAGAGDGAGGFGNPVQEAVPESVDALAAAAAPSKKETSLREFMGRMDEYAPIIPDAVTAHYLTLAGLPPPGHGPNQTPPHLARLLALAAQKFIADIAADSYQYARIRASNSSSASNPMGSLNAASGLGVPAAGAGASAAGAAAGVSGGGGGGGGGGGESGKSKANTHLGIQRPGFGGGGSGGSGQGRTVLTMEDLGMAVGEYGVSVKRGEFYR